jgi:hypothetical protein
MAGLPKPLHGAFFQVYARIICNILGEILSLAKGGVMLASLLALLFAVFVFYLLFADVTVGIVRVFKEAKEKEEMEAERRLNSKRDSDQNPDSN